MTSLELEDIMVIIAVAVAGGIIIWLFAWELTNHIRFENKCEEAGFNWKSNQVPKCSNIEGEYKIGYEYDGDYLLETSRERIIR